MARALVVAASNAVCGHGARWAGGRGARFSLRAMVSAYQALYDQQLAAAGCRTTSELTPCAESPASSTLAAARPIDRALLQRMNESQRHRGPDEGSVHVEPGVGLGHRRLSIIDLATGQQPLFNEDGSVVVVFNGEIYNYQELIPELQALGHVFHTKSDTEVIVHAWESLGRGLRQALPRHVRLRALGPQPRRRCSSRATGSA